MPIFIAPTNRELKVVKLIASTDVKRHLENLGFVPGTTIKVLTKTDGGSLICQVRESRLALDGDIAKKIIVA